MDSEKIYDMYWAQGGHVTEGWARPFFNATLSELIGIQRVLDYGCGMGYGYQSLLRASVAEYVAADVSSVALNDAKAKGCSTLQIQSDGTVSAPECSFDGAICSEVFEHLWDPLASARELHRVLKPGGTLVATVPNFGYLPWRFMAMLRAELPSEPESKENRYRGVHIRYFNSRSLARMLRDAGFSHVDVSGWCGSSIWDIFWCAGPFWKISTWAHRYLPKCFHLSFLGRLFPWLFSERLRVVAVK